MIMVLQYFFKQEKEKEEEKLSFPIPQNII